MNKSNTECVLYARQMQFTWDHIHYMEVRTHQKVNPTSGFQAFTSDILHMVQCKFSNSCGGHLVFV